MNEEPQGALPLFLNRLYPSDEMALSLSAVLRPRLKAATKVVVLHSMLELRRALGEAVYALQIEESLRADLLLKEGEGEGEDEANDGR